MARIGNVIEGLKILAGSSLDGHSIAAEHDIIYAGKYDATYSEEEKTKLEELGWFLDDETGSYAHFV